MEVGFDVWEEERGTICTFSTICRIIVKTKSSVAYEKLTRSGLELSKRERTR